MRSRVLCSCVERVPRSSCTRVSTSVRSSPIRALYFCVRLYSANPQGLYTVCWCSPPRALYFCVLQYGASPNGLCAVRTRKGVIQCVGTRPPELCTQFLSAPSVRCEPKGALCGASLQGLYTVCWCSPPRALHPVLMCSCGSCGRAQMSSCRRTCTSVRYELTRSLCFCAGGGVDELLYGNLYVCTVRAHNGFMQCASELVSPNEVFVWNQYACVSYAKTRS